MSSRHEHNLRPYMRFFYIAAAMLLAVAVISVSQLRERRLLENTLKEVTRVKEGFVKVKAAAANRRDVLSAIRSQLDQNARNISPEMVLYKKLDELKANLNPDDITMGSIEKKGGEASLPFTLVFSKTEFNALLNIVNDLHGSTFPLTPVSSISVASFASKDSSGVTYKIAGKIITDDKVKP